MTTLTMTKSQTKHIRRHARAILAGWQKRAEDYRQDCEQAYAEGFRPMYCEHGTYMWVDYDVMCQDCEDSFHYADQTFTDALAYALGEFRTMQAASARYNQRIVDFKAKVPEWKNLPDFPATMRELFREDFKIVDQYLDTMLDLE